MGVNVNNLKSPSEVRYHYVYVTPDGKDVVLSENYFIHAHANLNTGSRIEVWDEALTYRMDLFVKRSTRLCVEVVVVNEQSFVAKAVPAKPKKPEAPAKQEAPTGTGLTVKWRGKAGFSVMDLDGIGVIKDGFASHEEAEKWIEDNK